MKYIVNASKEHYYYMVVDAETSDQAEEKAINAEDGWISLDEGYLDIIEINKITKLGVSEGRDD